MNEALINELNKLFYSSEYDELAQYEIPSVDEPAAKWLKERGIPHNEYIGSELEEIIASNGVALERQGFLRGCEYALTMMGMNQERAL